MRSTAASCRIPLWCLGAPGMRLSPVSPERRTRPGTVVSSAVSNVVPQMEGSGAGGHRQTRTEMCGCARGQQSRLWVLSSAPAGLSLPTRRGIACARLRENRALRKVRLVGEALPFVRSLEGRGLWE